MTAVTCDGRCCAVFPLRKEAIEQIETDVSAIRDGAFIRDMLIPLTRRQAVARARRFGFTLPWRVGRTHRYFTCRHWDEGTRRCTVYADRPAMCRDYPYDHGCDHADCCYQAPKKTQARWRGIRRRLGRV